MNEKERKKERKMTMKLKKRICFFFSQSLNLVTFLFFFS